MAEGGSTITCIEVTIFSKTKTENVSDTSISPGVKNDIEIESDESDISAGFPNDDTESDVSYTN
jgi:hypothetical protein